MTFWLQHGYGKGNRIVELASRDALDGLILSPAHEGVAALTATLREAESSGIVASVDPQTYIYSISGASARNHLDHGLEFDSIHWSVDPQTMESQVAAVIDANDRLGTAGPLIAPSLLQRGFTDSWTVASIQYARIAHRLAGSRDVLATVAVEEAALGQWSQIEEWLDIATTLDVAGFYVVVAREPAGYPSRWDTERAVNLMRLAYRLGHLNGYMVLHGYSDFEGLGPLAAGATGLASGWHYSLRQFRAGRWVPGGFGRQPVPRVTSEPLLTPINALGEADLILGSRLATDVIPDAQTRSALSRGPGSWGNAEAHVQHLEALSSAARGIAAPSAIPDRLDVLDERLGVALGLLERLEAADVALDRMYKQRLEAMQSAVQAFRRVEEV